MRAFVLLHGFTGAPDSWDRVIAKLPGPSCAIAPHLLGHGPDGANEPARTIEEEADRIARFALALDSPRVLGAYSLGARIGLTLLARHPAVFESAVLVGVHPGLASAPDRAARVNSDEAWAALLEREGLAAFVDQWEAQPLFASSQPSLPSALRAAERARRLSHSAAGLALSLRSHGLGRMSPVDPSQVRARVTLVAGELDRKFTARAHGLARRLASARVRVVKDVGHNVPLERPEEVARALKEACR